MEQELLGAEVDDNTTQVAGRLRVGAESSVADTVEALDASLESQRLEGGWEAGRAHGPYLGEALMGVHPRRSPVRVSRRAFSDNGQDGTKGTRIHLLDNECEKKTAILHELEE